MSRKKQFIEYLLANSDLFLDQTGTPHVKPKKWKKGVEGVLQIAGKRFGQLLDLEYYELYEEVIPNQAKAEIVRLLEARTRHEGIEKNVFIRVGYVGESVYIDSGDSDIYYRIKDGKVKKCRGSKCMFYRPETMRALSNVDLDNPLFSPLLKILNIEDKSDQKLLVVWLLNSLYLKGDNPILVFQGPKGSSKSFSQDIIGALIDPSTIDKRAAPRQNDSIAIGATNSFLVMYDNLSGLRPAQQNDLCMASTGGVYASRAKYTDRDESVMNIKCRVILNGIGCLITQEDLNERAIVINLKNISEEKRRLKSELLAEFEAARPRIIGWLYNKLGKVLEVLPRMEEAQGLPRLADFYQFGLAVEKVCGWKAGTFDKAFRRNAIASQVELAGSTEIGRIIWDMKEQDELPFKGTYSELLIRMKGFGLDSALTPKALSIELENVAPVIKSAYGVVIKQLPRSSVGRRLALEIV